MRTLVVEPSALCNAVAADIASGEHASFDEPAPTWVALRASARSARRASVRGADAATHLDDHTRARAGRELAWWVKHADQALVCL